MPEQTHDAQAIAALCPLNGVLGALREYRQWIVDVTSTSDEEARVYGHCAAVLMRQDGAWSPADQRDWLDRVFRERDRIWIEWHGVGKEAGVSVTYHSGTDLARDSFLEAVRLSRSSSSGRSPS